VEVAITDARVVGGQPRRRAVTLLRAARTAAVGGAGSLRAAKVAATVAGMLLIGYVVLGPLSDWMADDQASIDAVRERWIQFLALGTVIVGLANWRNSVKQRTTDSFVAGLDLLGADTDTRRVAGIYALERIAKEDPRLHADVVDILSTLVREVARDPDYEKRRRARLGTQKMRPQQDVQAALSVLGRRPTGRRERGVLRLADTYLEGANLRDARLDGAVLRRTTLVDARLEGASLRNAQLRSADLRDAHLHDADLCDAHLHDADLSRANLCDAHLHDADLSGAKLTNAHLAGSKGLVATIEQLAAAHCRPDGTCVDEPFC
jgi:Pentapeptide repeats (8 copies)